MESPAAVGSVTELAMHYGRRPSMVIRIAALRLALVLMVSAPLAAEANSLLATIETQSHGTLDCGNRARGFEGTDILYGLTDELTVAPTEMAEVGMGHVARPVVIRKPLDRCSPALFLALVGRNPITRVEIRLFDKQGVHFFTIRLENVRVTRIAREAREHGVHEDVAFAYQIFELTDERTGVSASHDFGS
jgi:type VI secretion system Hcp family effector